MSGFGTLSLSVSAPALSVWGPGFLCRAPPFSRSLCRGPALSLCRAPGALCVWARRLCVAGPALSVSGTGAFVSNCSVGAPPLSVSGCGALCVGPRALCVGGALCGSLCWALPLFELGSGPAVQIRVFIHPHVTHTVFQPPTQTSSDPRCGPFSARSTSSLPEPIRGTHPTSSDPRAPSGPANPQLRSACHPSSPARSLFQERTPNLTVWGIRDLNESFSCSLFGLCSVIRDLFRIMAGHYNKN